MRNLKKIFAVIMTVALLASMMVPALAAEVSYETEAGKLQAIGLYKGNTVSLDLESTLIREQGFAFVVRLLGKEDEVLAMSQADIDAALADVVDADKIGNWAKPYAAYVVSAGITNGVGGAPAGKIMFAGANPLSGKEFITMVLRAMGYQGVTMENCVSMAVVDAKILSLSEAANFGTMTQINRDTSAGILFGSVTTGVVPAGTAFMETLITTGAVDRQTAVDNGFAQPPAPVALAVENITALNNKQVMITFNMEMDSTSATTKSFYTRAGAALNANDLVALQADKKSVIITLNTAETNQTLVKYAVKKDIKAANGSTLAAQLEKELNFTDVTIPSVVKVEQFGPKKIKLFFSEPVKAASSTGFKVDGGIYSPAVGTPDDQEYSIVLTFGTNLPIGEHKIVINPSNNKIVNDYQAATGLAIGETEMTFTMAGDTTAPSILSAVANSQTQVDITFSEPIDSSSLPGTSDIYHTATGYVASGVGMKSGSSDTLRVTFTANPLPAGNPTIYIAKDKIKDLFGNKMAASNVSVSVSIDNTKPTASLTVVNDKKLELYWSEGVTGSAAESNYVLKDSAGTVIVNKAYANASGHPIGSLSYDTTNKKTTIDFGSNNLPAGSYMITVSGVKDSALIANIMDEITFNFTITDGTKPTVGASANLTPATATVGQKIVITFSESMSDSILTSANYTLNGSALPSGTTIEAGADMKSAIITLPLTTTITSTATLVVGQVADSAGNKTVALATPVTLSDSNTITASNFKATSRTTVTFEVSYPLASINANNYTINGNIPATAGYENKTLSDGSTYGALVTLTVADGNKWNPYATPTVVINANAGADSLGRTIATNGPGGAPASDKTAPSVATLSDGTKRIYAKDLSGNSKIDTIEIKYDENILTGTVATGTYVVEGYTVSSVSLVDSDGQGAGGDGLTTDMVRLTVGEKSTADTAAAPRVKQLAAIMDSGSNVKEAETDFTASIDGTVPTIASITVNTVTGNNNDTMKITFSEAMKESVAEATDVLADITYVGSGRNNTLVALAAGTQSLTLSDNGKELTIGLAFDVNKNDAFAVTYTNPADATALVDTSKNANALATTGTAITGFVGGEVADTTAPTVVTEINAAGAATNEVILASGTATIVFSEKLDAASRTAVQTALTNGNTTTGTMSFTWTSDYSLLITETSTTNPVTFTGDVTANISDGTNTTNAAVLVDFAN